MPNFKNFANGGMNDGSSSEFTPIRHRQERDTKVGSRVERVWATDFERCESREDFEKYISKYERYESNQYVSKAKAKIESLDAAEKARIEKEKANQRVLQIPIAPGSGGSGTPPKYRMIQTCVKALVWIVIIGGVGFYSYNQYKKTNDTTTVVVPDTSQTQNSQDVAEQDASHIHSSQSDETEQIITETEPETQEIWWDCNICGTTGRCQLCFGSGRCAVCQGTGQVFSVFDGGEVVPGRMTDCGNCDGTGRCPSCDGSGACFACHGSGRCKLEE